MDAEGKKRERVIPMENARWRPKLMSMWRQVDAIDRLKSWSIGADTTEVVDRREQQSTDKAVKFKVLLRYIIAVNQLDCVIDRNSADDNKTATYLDNSAWT